METAAGMVLGAAIGGVVGFLLARMRLCASGTCRTRANLIFTVLAGAFFGTAIAWYWMHR